MRIRITVFALLLALALPAIARANEGILLIAHNGTPEWNAQLKDLAAKVDAQKPADVSFGSPTRSTIAAAVDRLAKRGVTEVIAVPFFLSTPISPEDLTGHAVPIRIGPAAEADHVFAEIIASRAQEISPKPGDDIVVLIGYGSEDAGTPWKVDLAPSARQLNGARAFGAMLTIGRPDTTTEKEQQQIRNTLDRHVAMGRRIVVVPVMMSASGPDPKIAQLLQGFSYETAKRGIIPDDRLVRWLVQARAR